MEICIKYLRLVESTWDCAQNIEWKQQITSKMKAPFLFLTQSGHYSASAFTFGFNFRSVFSLSNRTIYSTNAFNLLLNRFL